MNRRFGSPTSQAKTVSKGARHASRLAKTSESGDESPHSKRSGTGPGPPESYNAYEGRRRGLAQDEPQTAHSAMSPFEDLSPTVENFSGEVRLFPLPDLVLFPHVMQPLHIFEPRYRSLLEDALEDDRLITMCLLRPGWERDYEGRPPLYPTACLGRVTAHRRLDDGTYNLLLLGLHRVRLVRELSPRRRYREARAELCEDYVPPLSAAKQKGLARRLRDAFLKALPLLPDAKEQLEELVDGDVPLATLTDLVSYVLELEPAKKHQLLAEVNVWRRANLLLEHLLAAERAGAELLAAGFPPQFSSN